MLYILTDSFTLETTTAICCNSARSRQHSGSSGGYGGYTDDSYSGNQLAAGRAAVVDFYDAFATMGDATVGLLVEYMDGGSLQVNFNQLQFAVVHVLAHFTKSLLVQYHVKVVHCSVVCTSCCFSRQALHTAAPLRLRVHLCISEYGNLAP
jgi:hypothetical protein